MIVMAVVSNTSVIVYADNETTKMDQELLNDSREPIPKENNTLDVIESVTTTFLDETSSMIVVTAIVPENFGQSVYAQVKNLDVNVTYNLPLYSINGYSDRCYVPAGNYAFQMVAAYGDNANHYSFDFPENQFFVEAKQSAEFEIILNDFENEKVRIEEKYAEPKKIKELKGEEKKLGAESNFEIAHIGSGLAEVGIIGIQEEEYHLSIKIVEAGVLGQSSFSYSLDEGITWSETIKIPLSGYYTFGNSGLTITFYVFADDITGFVMEDIYSCYIPDPNTSIVIKQEGDSDAVAMVESNVPNMRAFDVLERMGRKIQIKILKDGNFGSAVWQVSKDGGNTWSEEDYAKEKLVISSDTEESLSVTIKFHVEAQKSETAFLRDDMYTIYAERKVDSSGIIAIMVLLVLGAIVGIVVYFGNKKLKAAIPQESEYELHK